MGLPVKIMARIVARPEHAATVERALSTLAAATRGEAGCESYEVYRDTDAPGVFVTVELWRDQADADAHMTSPHVAAAITTVGSLLAQAPEIHRYERAA